MALGDRRGKECEQAASLPRRPLCESPEVSQSRCPVPPHSNPRRTRGRRQFVVAKFPATNAGKPTKLDRLRDPQNSDILASTRRASDLDVIASAGWVRGLGKTMGEGNVH